MFFEVRLQRGPNAPGFIIIRFCLVSIPFSKARTSDAVEHKSGGRLGPITKVGRMVTKSILFSLQNSHAAFSARVFAKAYQIFCDAPHFHVQEETVSYLCILRNVSRNC